ncbi:MAG TPA: response regulator [Acetobacteraceae bacterium]|nr:response regulator [Acetobacteraceae bacterium]
MTVTVLIVDDSKLARIVTGKKLAALQPEWRRLEASNADEAMAMVRESPVDVALVDYNMPGRNGLELAAELRALWPTMPIAVTTANVQDEIIANTRAVNAVFVAKPVTEEGLSSFVAGAALRLRMPS